MTWRIKAAAAWHDGTAFTAEDLLFALKVEQDKEVPIAHPSPLDLIDDISVPDPRTVVVTWKRPYIEADTLFTVPPPPCPSTSWRRPTSPINKT